MRVICLATLACIVAFLIGVQAGRVYERESEEPKPYLRAIVGVQADIGRGTVDLIVEDEETGRWSYIQAQACRAAIRVVRAPPPVFYRVEPFRKQLRLELVSQTGN